MLAMNRFVLISSIFLLIYNLVIDVGHKAITKPHLRIYVDNSESIKEMALNSQDPLLFLEQITDSIRSLSDWNVELYEFGSKLQTISNISELNFNDELTNYSSIFENEKQLKSDVVYIITDGNWNIGKDPSFYNGEVTGRLRLVPFFLPKYKDTYRLNWKTLPDRLIRNKKITVSAELSRQFKKSDTLQITLFENETKVLEQNLIFPPDELVTEIKIPYQPVLEGNRLLSVRVHSSALDLKYELKKQVIVLPGVFNIAVFYNKPHADLRLLRDLQRQDSLLNFIFVPEWDKDWENQLPKDKLHGIILFNAPTQNSRKAFSRAILSLIKNSRTPVWLNITPDNQYIVKQLSDKIHIEYESYRQVYIKPRLMGNPETMIYKNNDFNERFWQNLPTIATLGVRTEISAMKPVLTVKPGKNKLNILMKGMIHNQFYLISSMEGLLRLKLYYGMNEEFQNGTNIFLRNLIYVLLNGGTHRYIRLNHSPEIIQTQMPVRFRVGLVGPDGNPVSGATVDIRIEKDGENIFLKKIAVLNKENSEFMVEFPDTGLYTLDVNAGFDTTVLEERKIGIFVEANKAEEDAVGNNYGELKRISEIFQQPPIESIQDLFAEIQTLREEKPVSRIVFNRITIKPNVWILLFILGLLTAEWFIRKYWNLL